MHSAAEAAAPAANETGASSSSSAQRPWLLMQQLQADTTSSLSTAGRSASSSLKLSVTSQCFDTRQLMNNLGCMESVWPSNAGDLQQVIQAHAEVALRNPVLGC